MSLQYLSCIETELHISYRSFNINANNYFMSWK